jgi:PadR family transcriptional regulator, regulatory protein PadR
VLPLEVAILEHGVSADTFYGFALARSLSDGDSALTAHGTLYKALARMTDAGLLSAEWENHSSAEAEGRPRRRLYRVTAEGSRALAAAHAVVAVVAAAPVSVTAVTTAVLA